MTPLLAFVLASQSTALTYISPAMTVDRLLSDLSSKKALSLRTDGPIGQDIVVVSLKDVSLDEFKKQLAVVTVGEWRQDGNTWILSRDTAKANNQAKEEVARLAKNYTTAIANFTQSYEDTVALTATEAERRLKLLAELNDRVKQGINAGKPVGVQPGGTPQERLLARTLRSLDTAELASLPNASRTVFSTSPNRMQKPLPNSAIKALQSFEAEYGIWQNVATRYRPQDDENLFVDFGYFGAMKARPAKTLVVATKWGEGSSISLEVKVVDTRGKIVSSSAAGLDGTALQVATATEADDADSKPIQLSRDSLELSALKNGAFRQGEPLPLSASLRAKLLNPETNDPLGFTPSECLLGLAEAEGKNLIATVPDSAAEVLINGPTIQSSQVRRSFVTADTLAFEDQDGWIVATPSWPARARSSRLSRSSLGQLLREVDRPSKSTLEPLSRFAAQTPGNTPSGLAVSSLMILQPAVASNLDASAWELLRLYASLPTGLKQATERSKITIQTLDSKGKNALNQLVFFSSSSIAMGAFQSVAQTEESGGVVEYDPFESATSEPTEALPNGLPDTAEILVDRSQVQVAVAATGVSFSSDDLGTQLAMRERPELFPFVSEAPLPAKYTLAMRDSLLITLAFNQEPMASFILNDFQKGTSTWYGVNDFPSEFKQEVDRARKEARDSFKDMKSTGQGTGGGTNIPPR